jgi:colanic acid biosynthesis glycosyl transferase WcaI
MHVLIITPNYEPDLGPSAPLFTMLSKGLVENGHKVTVIAAVPHYPSGQVPVEFQGKWIWRSHENGVDILRIGLPSVERKNLSKRFIQFIWFQLLATFACRGLEYDSVIVAGPAIQVWLPFTWAVNLRRKPAVISIHDVYPDVGIKLGIFKNKLVISTIAGLERSCLNHATIVRILSDSFRPGILNLGIPEIKIRLVYDWVDTKLITPLPQDNTFTREYGLSDRFIVLYAGNIGLSQGLEHILTTAKILTNQKDILFLFVGDGAGKDSLQNQANEQHLVNVTFIPFQPRERLPEVLASADVSLVILRHGIGAASLPSKTFSIMASGRPIIVSVDEDSETWKLIRQAEAGLWVPPEDPAKLAETILILKEEKALCERLGQKGRIWSEQHHSPQYATEQFEKLLFEAVKIHNQ